MGTLLAVAVHFEGGGSKVRAADRDVWHLHSITVTKQPCGPRSGRTCEATEDITFKCPNPLTEGFTLLDGDEVAGVDNPLVCARMHVGSMCCPAAAVLPAS